ncbi:hypothetical protein C8J57DRAFT_1211755 [Mycena rebaudengoi]|nr:hypothetical protein C8J57DRAFT_1211755 [Mycena rebaudengoi]
MRSRRAPAQRAVSPPRPDPDDDVLAPDSGESDEDEDFDLAPNSGDDYIPSGNPTASVPPTLRSRRSREPSAPSPSPAQDEPSATPKSKRRRRTVDKGRARDSPRVSLTEFGASRVGEFLDNAAGDRRDVPMQPPSPALSASAQASPSRPTGMSNESGEALAAAPRLVVTSPRTDPAFPTQSPSAAYPPSSLLPPFNLAPSTTGPLPRIDLLGARPPTASGRPAASSSAPSIFNALPTRPTSRPSPLNPSFSLPPPPPRQAPPPTTFLPRGPPPVSAASLAPPAPTSYVPATASATTAQAATAPPFVVMTAEAVDRFLEATRDRTQGHADPGRVMLSGAHDSFRARAPPPTTFVALDAQSIAFPRTLIAIMEGGCRRYFPLSMLSYKACAEPSKAAKAGATTLSWNESGVLETKETDLEDAKEKDISYFDFTEASLLFPQLIRQHFRESVDVVGGPVAAAHADAFEAHYDYIRKRLDLKQNFDIWVQYDAEIRNRWTNRENFSPAFFQESIFNRLLMQSRLSCRQPFPGTAPTVPTTQPLSASRRWRSWPPWSLPPAVTADATTEIGPQTGGPFGRRRTALPPQAAAFSAAVETTRPANVTTNHAGSRKDATASTPGTIPSTALPIISRAVATTARPTAVMRTPAPSAAPAPTAPRLAPESDVFPIVTPLRAQAWRHYLEAAGALHEFDDIPLEPHPAFSATSRTPSAKFS